MQITINLTPKELTENTAIIELLRGQTAEPVQTAPQPIVPPTPAVQQTIPQAMPTATPQAPIVHQPVPQPQYNPPIPPAQIPQQPAQAPMPQPTMPTAQSAYDIAAVAQSAAVFAETSDDNRNKIIELIRKFGAAALTDIPKERIGEFVTDLRMLGVRI